MRRRLRFATGFLHRRRFAVGQQGKIEQAVGIVVSGAQQLAAGDIFVDRGDAALEAHPGGINRFADRQPRQGGAVGAQQENGFDVIAAGLLQRQRRQFAVGDAAFGHHPVHRQAELFAYLLDAQFGKPSIAPSFLLLQSVSGANRLLAAFDGNIHLAHLHVGGTRDSQQALAAGQDQVNAQWERVRAFG